MSKFPQALPQFHYRMFASFVLSALLLISMGVLPVNADSSKLQSDVSQLQGAGASSVVAQVSDHGNVTNAVAGSSELGTNLPVATNTNYRTGSVTKTFVAVVILQLVAEGKMSLEDTVDKWLPGEIQGNGNDGKKITVRQLLQHQSGVFDYTSDIGFDNTIFTPDEFYANRFHHYMPQDLVNIALAHAPNFEPGTAWSYSNTNYVIAGQIIKAVTGNDWGVEVTNRIINPLGLTQTIANPGDTATMPSPFARAYNMWSSSPSNRIYSDTTDDNMTWADAAGAVITTTGDANKFFTALLSGRLLPAAQLAQMQTTVPITAKTGYGLGIAFTRLNCTGMGGVWWHDGGTIGYGTWVGVTPDGLQSLAFDLSTTSFTGADVPYISGTSGLEDPLIRHVFCGGSATKSTSMTQEEQALHGNSKLP